MDRPSACHFASVQDGKQEIYLEWPYTKNQKAKLISVLRDKNSCMHVVRF